MFVPPLVLSSPQPPLSIASSSSSYLTAGELKGLEGMYFPLNAPKMPFTECILVLPTGLGAFLEKFLPPFLIDPVHATDDDDARFAVSNLSYTDFFLYPLLTGGRSYIYLGRAI